MPGNEPCELLSMCREHEMAGVLNGESALREECWHARSRQSAACRSELFNDRSDIVSPLVTIGILLGLKWRVRHSVTAQVERDHTEFVVQFVLALVHPTQIALRPTVDQEDRDARGLAPLANVQLHASGAMYRVGDHSPICVPRGR